VYVPITTAVAGAVVGHGHLDVPVVVAHEHLRVLRTRVLERVRETLLDETVRGEVKSGG
jgi:hypothetical protein